MFSSVMAIVIQSRKKEGGVRRECIGCGPIEVRDRITVNYLNAKI